MIALQSLTVLSEPSVPDWVHCGILLSRQIIYAILLDSTLYIHWKAISTEVTSCLIKIDGTFYVSSKHFHANK